MYTHFWFWLTFLLVGLVLVCVFGRFDMESYLWDTCSSHFGPKQFDLVRDVERCKTVASGPPWGPLIKVPRNGLKLIRGDWGGPWPIWVPLEGSFVLHVCKKCHCPKQSWLKTVWTPEQLPDLGFSGLEISLGHGLAEWEWSRDKISRENHTRI